MKKWKPVQDVETVKTEVAALHTLLMNSGIIATSKLKFDVVLCDLTPDTAPRLWNSKRIERVLDFIDQEQLQPSTSSGLAW